MGDPDLLRRELRYGVAIATAIAVLLCVRDFAWAATEVGATAPPLVVKELSGQTFDLSAMRGKVVVINFWATWCPPCRKEMPALDAFYRDYHDRGVEVIGLSIERSRKHSDVAEMMQSYRYRAAMLADSTSNGFATPAVLPETIVIDRDSIIRAVLKSDQTVMTENDLSAVVLPLLAQKQETPAPIASKSTAKP